MNTDEYNFAVRRAIQGWSRAQFACDVKLMLGVMIDEISLIFTPEDLDSFRANAAFDSIEHTRTEEQSHMRRYVPRQDLPEGRLVDEFDVRFEFFQMPEVDWRIEAMGILAGSAPLHEKFLAQFDYGWPFHASYKLQGETEYEAELERLAEYGLQCDGMYRNEYGKFSYWSSPEYAPMYLKPRCNLRDQTA